MKNAIELLEVGLLDEKEKLTEIDYWLNVFNWPNGWHYDLDVIWTLKHIEALNLPKGATIIDAGAGLGVTQFILAARGYNVISLDFTKRLKPRFAEGIFDIKIIDSDLDGYRHEYMSFMSHGQPFVEKPRAQRKNLRAIAAKLLHPSKVLKYLAFLAYRAADKLHSSFNIHYYTEKSKDHSGYGKITFLRGIFNKIPLADRAADLLVSISAFEHNTYEDMQGSVEEFSRVLKDGALMLITTSASGGKDWYFEPSKGWNLSHGSLANWFRMQDSAPFDYPAAFLKMTGSAKMRGRISTYYKFSGNSGLPFGNLNDAKYVPVGIARCKF
jgi:ubiquinone/menaquinone biosynthesis C-methylase UbiE